MSLVTPFGQCIARPDMGDKQFSLEEHLEAVATGCGDADGRPEERLAFLAGLLHDAAKAHADWQDYIRGCRTKGPSHAPLGAALFAFCSDSLIPAWTQDRLGREYLQDLALDWIRAIYDHHGELDDLDTRSPWEFSLHGMVPQGLLERCDTHGLFSLVTKHFRELTVNDLEFLRWLENFPPKWERRVRFGRTALLRQSLQIQADGATTAGYALRMSHLTARLVCADRYHAGGFERTTLSATDAAHAAENLRTHIGEIAVQNVRSGADPTLVRLRGQAREKALDVYRSNPDGVFFTLLLPTGYGKTLTGLSVAIEACRSGRCERILYVAPYISILSQAAEEISTICRLEVFQHHHLTLTELADDEDIDILDTWQAPVLATTFNQLFRALFPRRAQETLRTEAIHHAFVIIDEPQITDTAVWNLLLQGLAIASREWGCQVLFATATLPPTKGGLDINTVPLASERTSLGRFTLAYDNNPRTPREVADWVCKLRDTDGSIAVVLNTVLDAVQVYQLLREEVTDGLLCCLTAMMLSAHKAMTIERIRKQLSMGKPVVTICTQILEAGVNLSFRHILRALPVFPSVVQVAGRANRHGEGDRATVTVFPFVRDDGSDTRAYVYRDETALRQTDNILTNNPLLGEEAVGVALESYFQRCWDENRYTSCLARFDDAARGRWSALAGLQPFAGDAPRDEVFVVPRSSRALASPMSHLLQKFAPEGPEQLLEKWIDSSFRRELSFSDRKRFRALLQQFCVPVPRKVAAQFADPVTDWLWRLSDFDDYCEHTGLAHLLEGEPDHTVLIV